VCDLMADRGVTIVHTTVLRWVQRFVPAFEKMWKKYARPVGSSWRVDETYIIVKEQWRNLYRAVDKQGQTVDFTLSKNRDKAAAVRFFCSRLSALRARSAQGGRPNYGNPDSVTRHDKMARPGKEPSE
jgi:transposase-like protein